MLTGLLSQRVESTATTGESIVFLAVFVVLILAVGIGVHTWKARRRRRPYAVQARTIATRFNGAPTAICYTTYTTYATVSNEQIIRIAAQCGYVFVEQKSTYRGNRYLVFRRGDLPGQTPDYPMGPMSP